MKIVVFEVEDPERQAFEGLSRDQEVLFTDEKVTGNLNPRYRDADIISAFIYSELSSSTLRQFDRLRLIDTRSTGFSHIDLDYCRRNGIAVSNAPDYGQNTVAEHVFALLQAISRHIPEAVERTRSGDFSQEGLEGFDLRGKTLGVIGTGDIGKNVIRIAGGFGMKVLAFDPKPDSGAAEQMGFRYTDMDELLSQSDIVTLHVPGTEKTRDLISESEFARMKQGVVLINTARGTVVNVQALLKALSEKKVAAAGLDVLPREPVIREESELLRAAFTGRGHLQTLLADEVLKDLPNVLITPHVAFDTREALQRLLSTSVENIASFIRGRPHNLVGKGT